MKPKQPVVRDSKSKNKKMQILKITAGALLFFVGGGLVGFYYHALAGKNPVAVVSSPIREHSSEYRFIQPLLATSNPVETPSPQYQNVYSKLLDFIKKNTSKDDTVSVYFSDLNQGGRFEINQDQGYVPASLMKIVIMIAYLKQAQTQPELLNDKLIYESNTARELESIPFESPTTLTLGSSYTIQELIDNMITSSDNGAMNLLADSIDENYLNKVYSDLGLKGPDENATYTISVKDYSLFFRILYNGTYLNDAMSEKALSILSEVTFSDGITASLPQDIVVAHKFGEHVIGTQDQVTGFELHDCGIVYLPNDPYFLCVMTHGKTLQSVENIIQGISSIVYANQKSTLAAGK